jgi:hypothetical protein
LYLIAENSRRSQTTKCPKINQTSINVQKNSSNLEKNTMNGMKTMTKKYEHMSEWKYDDLENQCFSDPVWATKEISYLHKENKELYERNKNNSLLFVVFIAFFILLWFFTKVISNTFFALFVSIITFLFLFYGYYFVKSTLKSSNSF